MYKLLIVDDEAEIRDGLFHYFPWKQLGYEIAALLENGRQALEYLEQKPVDVMLCDIKMPFMNGLDLAKELYAKNSAVKILLLSGYREFEYAQEALRYGVKDYLVKPTKYDELIKVFSKLKKELDKEAFARGIPVARAEEGRSYNEQVVELIKSYLRDNLQTATLEEAARLVHMSPVYLSKFFKEKTGANFSDFLMALRMEKASLLLRDISYKTYEISQMLGYSNSNNFTRTFKKFFGKTPKEFRNSP